MPADALPHPIGPDLFSWRGQNPVLQGIPPIMSKEEMRNALSYDPRSLWTAPPSSKADRQKEAMRIKYLSVPTDELCELGVRLLLTVHLELEKHDPRVASNRAAVYARGMQAGKGLKEIPWELEGAPGFILEGPTGESKSMFVERFCALLPQTLHREENRDCGWLAFTQVVYLRVSMPTAKSRAGFILEIAKALDAAAGTDYSKELNARSMSIDKQLVMLLIWMSLHRVALLIVEEAQEESMGELGKEYMVFLLKVLNWGIIVLISGNPKALKIVKTFSQDNRRLSEGGEWTILPITDPKSKEWTDQLVPGIWGFNVLPNDDEPIDDLGRALFVATGGQRYALARLRREALLLAIESDSDRVTNKHVMASMRSPSMRPLQRITTALVRRDAGVLQTFADYPVDLIQAKWDADDAAKGSKG